MKHITTTRSLATAAITGALVFGTAGLAQADDDSSARDSQSQNTSKTELGAPIQFGGVTLENSSSSSNAQNDSTTDGDESTSSSSTDANDSSQRVHFGAFSFDPSFLYEAAEAQRQAEQSTDDGDDVSSIDEQASDRNVEGKAPAVIGGADGVFKNHDKSTSGSTSRDGDESTSHSDATENHSEQGFDIQDTLIDPLFGNGSTSGSTERSSILN